MQKWHFVTNGNVCYVGNETSRVKGWQKHISIILFCHLDGNNFYAISLPLSALMT